MSPHLFLAPFIVLFQVQRPALTINCLVLYPLPGPPVAVGMSIDVASIDMVSEVNMVSELMTFPLGHAA